MRKWKDLKSDSLNKDDIHVTSEVLFLLTNNISEKQWNVKYFIFGLSVLNYVNFERSK